MALKVESRDIDGYRVTVSQLPVFRAQKVLVKIGRVAGPALAKLSGGNLLDLKVEALGSAVGELFERLSPEELEALERELFETALIEVNGNTQRLLQVIEAVYQGSVLSVLKVLVFALEVNFSDFWRALPRPSAEVGKGNPSPA